VVHGGAGLALGDGIPADDLDPAVRAEDACLAVGGMKKGGVQVRYISSEKSDGRPAARRRSSQYEEQH
jgi:hypothetical protein